MALIFKNVNNRLNIIYNSKKHLLTNISKIKVPKSLFIDSHLKMYHKEFTKYEDLIKQQETVLKIKDDYSTNNNNINHCWLQLMKEQDNLKDIHSKLDILTQNKETKTLLDKESQILNNVRSLNKDFFIYDKIQRSILNNLNFEIRKGFEAEENNKKRILLLLFLSTFIGILLGILAAIISSITFSNISKINNIQDTENLIIKFKNLIIDENSKTKINLDFFWKIIGSQIITSNFKNFDNSLALTNDKFLSMTATSNESALKEMIEIEKTIYNIKLIISLPILVLEKDNFNANEKGLWLMTFTYGSVALLLPIILTYLS